MAKTSPVVERSLGLLMPLGPVRARAMFGGWGIYLEEVMFALIAYDRLYLKVDAETVPRFAEAGAQPFTYEGKGKPIQMSYWTAPEGTMESAEALLPWAELALAAARRGRAKKKPKKAVKRG